jgi:hypothetical protein
MIDGVTGVITPESTTTDPDDLLARFRALRQQIRAEIDSYNPDDRVENPGDCADHHDRLEDLYSDASDLMAAMDDHLTTGGRPPTAWAAAYAAPGAPAATGGPHRIPR